MKSTQELRKELSDLYSNVRDKKTDVATAKTLVSASNAILKSVQMELEQNKFLKNKKAISFLK